LFGSEDLGALLSDIMTGADGATLETFTASILFVGWTVRTPERKMYESKPSIARHRGHIPRYGERAAPIQVKTSISPAISSEFVRRGGAFLFV
jgi:hypothetical protein